MTLRDILNPWRALREERVGSEQYWRLWQDVCEANGALCRERDALRAELASETAEHEATRDFLATTERQCDAWKARAEAAERQAVELAGSVEFLMRVTRPKRDAKGRFT